MIVLLFCLVLASPLHSVPIENSVQERFFGLFKPDCSRPVFAPFGIYNPCPETTTPPTTAPPTTTIPTTVPSTTAASCSSSSMCSDGSSGCTSGTTCYDGSNVLNGNCCGQVSNFCLIQSASAGLGVSVVCPWEWFILNQIKLYSAVSLFLGWSQSFCWAPCRR